MQVELNKNDARLISAKIDRALFLLAKTYLPFIFALVLAYVYTKPKTDGKRISVAQFETIYLIVFLFFLIIFSIFCTRDYQRKVVPYRKEKLVGFKHLTPFVARKYYHPIYKQHLLYHPTNENKYILLSEKDFNNVDDGQNLELHTGSSTGIVLGISHGDEYLDCEEFTFGE